MPWAASAAQQCPRADRLPASSPCRMVARWTLSSVPPLLALSPKVASGSVLEGRRVVSQGHERALPLPGGKAFPETPDRPLLHLGSRAFLDVTGQGEGAGCSRFQPAVIWLLCERGERGWVLGRQPGTSAEPHLVPAGNEDPPSRHTSKGQPLLQDCILAFYTIFLMFF